MRIYDGTDLAKAFSGKFLWLMFTDSSFGIISFAVDMGFIVLNDFYIYNKNKCVRFTPKKKELLTS